jgi:hypothetical protein
LLRSIIIGTTERQMPADHPDGIAQNTQICATQPAAPANRCAAHNGGSRATAAASDYHAARLVFRSASDLIAEYLRDVC